MSLLEWADMSKRILKLPLSELKTVRVLCKGKKRGETDCGAVIEMPLARLASIAKNPPTLNACPFCGTPFHLGETDNKTADPRRG
jgi:hypothetical protein